MRKNRKHIASILFCLILLSGEFLNAQNERHYISPVWVSDLGNGTYRNPILHADYSDPDVCRVGDDFYMVSSSFNAIPGLPILHSRDLVNWRILGHALKRLPPVQHFETPQHGNGVWAPSIRYHNNEFHIYYPDPDFGIYLVKSKNPEGPWSDPVLVEPGKGLIDPCPLWDDDGKIYLVYAFAGSRAGIKSILAVRELSGDGEKTLGEGRIVYDGHVQDPTVEGPKFYKRNGFYYIFAPAGGVATGWQIVLRSRSVYGPYERKVVMHQGKSSVNGPHQGAWVDTPSGQDWFIHFQDKHAYGRVVHLQPMTWKKDWPVIGVDHDGDGTGEPVSEFKKPAVGKTYPVQSPLESDEFESPSLSSQWQWHANPKATWLFLNQGVLRLYAHRLPDSARNLWHVPNLLTQKFPAEEFTVTTKLVFSPNSKLKDERAGLVVMGLSYAYAGLRSTANGTELIFSTCQGAEKGTPESIRVVKTVTANEIFLMMNVRKGAICTFSYSLDARKWHLISEEFTAEPGKWIGAKVGLFCTRAGTTNDSGYVDIDWFRFTQ